jgi:PAS domain S-box-containing protein
MLIRQPFQSSDVVGGGWSKQSKNDQMSDEQRSIGPTLKTKAELFELIVESSTDFAIYTVDSDGNATSWNIGAERLFGYSEKEIVGSTADIVFIPEDREKGAPEHERRQALREGRGADDRWHQRKDGSRFWASGLMMPLKDGPGFVKITRDRTEQYHASQRLRENEERFRLLATSIPQLVFQTRHDGFRTWGSPQWIEFTGLSLDDSVGFGWLDAIHPDDRAATQQAWEGAAERGEYYAEHRIRRQRDEEYRWHQTRAKPIDGLSPISNDWVGTMTDIHELRGLQHRQGVLVAELQHRTRNLLAVVQSVASQTARKSTTLSGFQREFESRLRALSRVQGLISRVDYQDVDLHTLIEMELRAHTGDGDKSGKVVVQGPPAALPASAAQVLALAVHELATNAVKYGALVQPSGKLTVTWHITNERGEPRAALQWRETGVPIAVDSPKRKGYGSELIEKAMPYQLEAETDLHYGPDGVICSIVVPVRVNGGGA